MAILISIGNDIHIALSETNSKTTDECSTVTAEIIPHCRPAIWSRFHDELNAKVERVSRQESSTVWPCRTELFSIPFDIGLALYWITVGLVRQFVAIFSVTRRAI